MIISINCYSLLSSDISSPEAFGIGIIVESISTFHHLDALVSLSISDKMAWDCSVSSLAFSTCNMPSVSYHELKVIIAVNTCRYIGIVVFKFLFCYLTVFLSCIPLSHELLKNLILSHLSTDELWMLCHIVCLCHVFNIYKSITSSI